MPPRDFTIEQLKRLYGRGLSQRQIARILGSQQYTVHYWLKKLRDSGELRDIEVRREEGRKSFTKSPLDDSPVTRRRRILDRRWEKLTGEKTRQKSAWIVPASRERKCYE